MENEHSDRHDSVFSINLRSSTSQAPHVDGVMSIRQPDDANRLADAIAISSDSMTSTNLRPVREAFTVLVEDAKEAIDFSPGTQGTTAVR